MDILSIKKLSIELYNEKNFNSTHIFSTYIYVAWIYSCSIAVINANVTGRLNYVLRDWPMFFNNSLIKFNKESSYKGKCYLKLS